MGRKTATIIGGCCAFALLFMGGCSILLYYGGKKLVSGYQDIQAKADAQATVFLTAVGKGDDSTAYALLSPSAKQMESENIFHQRMTEFRARTGDFGPPFPASGVSVNVNNADRVTMRQYEVHGSKRAATMSITLHQLGSNPWEIQSAF